MSETIRRRKERYSSDRTVIFSELNSPVKYQNVKMYNFNVDGIFFEADRALIPDSEIIIEVSNYFPGPVVEDGSDSYRAKVKWCNRIEESESFAVGTEILGHYHKKSH